MTAQIENTRNAPLPTLMEILQDQQARKIDLVIPASKLKFADGDLVLSGLDPIMEEDGVTDPNGTYQPTPTFDDHLAERLDIHPSYLRRLRHGKTHAKTGKTVAEPRLDLYDANANGLLGGRKPKVRRATLAETAAIEDGACTSDDLTVTMDGKDFTWSNDAWSTVAREGVPADSRSFLLRTFRSDATGRGIARGLMSNRYLRMENIDGAMAMLQGIVDAGIDASTLEIYGDLTETRMYIHVRAPQIATWAPELLDGYRSPFDTGVEGAKRQAHGRTMQERIDLGRKLVEERGWNSRGTGPAAASGGFYAPGTEPIIHSGFKLMNSELGNGRWIGVPEFTVLACDNGVTQTNELFARTHLGSKLNDGHIEWSAETQGKELAWVASQTQDLVKLALSQEYLEERVEEMSQKAGKQVDEKKAATVLSSALKFDKSDQEGILRYFLMGGQHTAGGLMQAVTGYSQTLDADSQFELDNKAMQVLEVAAR